VGDEERLEGVEEVGQIAVRFFRRWELRF